MSWWNFLLLVVAVAIVIVIAGHCQFLMQSGTGRIDGIPVYILPSIRSTAVVAVFQASRRIIPHHTFMVALVFATLVLLCFVTITSCWSELQRCKQYKEEKENAKVVHDSFAMIWLVWRLTLKITGWCENGQTFYTHIKQWLPNPWNCSDEWFILVCIWDFYESLLQKMKYTKSRAPLGFQHLTLSPSSSLPSKVQ